jgi:restriction endonuclease Mrr
LWRGAPIDIYTAVAAGFPDLTAEDQRQRLESGAVKWEKDVQFAGQHLFGSGQIDSLVRGLWRITPAGRDRLNGQGQLTSGTSRFVRATRPAVASLRPVPADEAEAPKVAIDAAYQRMRNVLVSDRLGGTE